jgi:NAD(P)-dependent dehydrogenase (short-subunit alcohol dehydrogenase family)
VIDFTGQVAVVTGAGRGLGRLYALDLARRGASVVVNDVGGTTDGHGEDAAVADAVVAEIAEITAAGRAGSTGGEGRAVASHDSVATPEGGAAVVRAALDRFGRLDILVSNAGIFQTVPFEELSPTDWRRMRRVHLDGGFHVSQPAFRAMKAQGGGGRFVFVASSAGLFGQAEAAHYAAAKAGLLGLANVIAIEGAEHGILANTVLPFGSSRMVTDAVGDREQFAEEIAFIDAIRPELVVPLVVFLASRGCDLTHHAFSACAGRFARVFVGLGEGWVAGTANDTVGNDTVGNDTVGNDDAADPTAEDIAAHLAEITATQPFTVPTSIYDEVAGVGTRLGLF